MDAHDLAQAIGELASENKINYKELFDGLAQVTAAFVIDLAKDNAAEEFDERIEIITNQFTSTLISNINYYKNLTE